MSVWAGAQAENLLARHDTRTRAHTYTHTSNTSGRVWSFIFVQWEEVDIPSLFMSAFLRACAHVHAHVQVSPSSFVGSRACACVCIRILQEQEQQGQPNWSP